MALFLRLFRTEIIQISRSYGSQPRNLCNHYQTLRVPADATQQDIRLAFIKLSKEMHPDLNKSTTDAEFAKINEAYAVLSKTHTRHDYDMDLKYNRTSNGPSVRVVYRDVNDAGPFRAGPRIFDPNDPSSCPPYYGIKGLKRIPNYTIVFLCLIISAIGLSVQLLLVNNSMTPTGDKKLSRGAQIQLEYKKAQAQAANRSTEEQILAMEQRLAAAKQARAKVES